MENNEDACLHCGCTDMDTWSDPEAADGQQFFYVCGNCGARGPFAAGPREARVTWQARAALTAPPAASADWVLVPREPDSATLTVMIDEVYMHSAEAADLSQDAMREVYRAILSATPPSAPAVTERRTGPETRRVNMPKDWSECLVRRGPGPYYGPDAADRRTAKPEGSK